uniref:Putative CMP/dCMP deaminase zinc-binding n=1 Tax=viral metagenome TaxID=1070528 RepID=A0A6M3IDF5_9ZZZZ
MVCENCDPKLNRQGRVIKVLNSDWKYPVCSECGDEISNKTSKSISTSTSWDQYFHKLCTTVASKSPCLSRQIGAVAVRDKSIITTGYNGPPRGIPHCGHDRLMKDHCLSNYFANLTGPMNNHPVNRIRSECPRQVLGYPSGTHMELCPAQHAEENIVSNAARNGVSILGATLYMNSVIPCQKCYGTLINAGFVEIVVECPTPYDRWTQFLIDSSDIKIRSFEL